LRVENGKQLFNRCVRYAHFHQFQKIFDVVPRPHFRKFSYFDGLGEATILFSAVGADFGVRAFRGFNVRGRKIFFHRIEAFARLENDSRLNVGRFVLALFQLKDGVFEMFQILDVAFDALVVSEIRTQDDGFFFLFRFLILDRDFDVLKNKQAARGFVLDAL